MNATETKNYVAAGKYENQNVVALRKTAQGKVPNAKRLRKPELIAALVEWDAKEAKAELRRDGVENRKAFEKAKESASKAKKTKTQTRVQAKPAKATSDHESDAKPAKKTSRKMCQVCSKRPVHRKTQGRDSTMCEPCYDYAGWENTHSDNGHEAMDVNAINPSDEEKAIIADMADCPVCQGNDPANDVVKTKANGSKPGRTVSKPMAVESKSFDAKAKAFAAIAKAAGWKAHTHKISASSAQVIAVLGAESLSMVWENGAYQYDLSEYKDDKGHKAKIRNASAARKIVEA
jgi:hypothetical protein